MPNDTNLFVFIMAGGSGERFWPLSRKKTPKHLLKLFSDKSLLQQTVLRLQGLAPIEQTFILINEAQRENTVKDLEGMLPAKQIICEPAKRDTAPAASLATAIARAQNPDATVVLLPADQLIKDIDTFQNNLRDGATVARECSALVTLGIQPTFASTGFGYLKAGDTLNSGASGTQFYKVSNFVEKPDAPTAQGYLDSGNYKWNAGMFIWQATSYLKVARNHQPELAAFIEGFPASDFTPYMQKHFEKLPKISVDYAIMEKAPEVIMALAGFDWDDVGSWSAVPNHLAKDSQDNTIHGMTVVRESSGNILYSTDRIIAVCGVENLVVVETDDAVLVCDRARVQEIKKLLPELPVDVL
ncbi:MAG: mannose-1-phosphate guanylyltransferase [Verrucomicrobiota bacterium]